MLSLGFEFRRGTNSKGKPQVKEMIDQDYVGQTISGCRIIKNIGQGGMGVVYEAEQASLDRKVAIKFLASSISGNKEFVCRFFREAKLVASLNHPNILQVYDVGQESNVVYMVTELVKGRTLNQILREKGRLPEEEALSIIYDIAAALGEAEEHNIVHRDLKPANVMVTHNNIVKVMDFGVAKNIADHTESITRTGDILGTPAYMSPEQIEGGDVDIRTDIYSLGLILFCLVTGKPACEGSTPATILHNQVYSPLPDLKKINPDLSDSVCSIITKMTSKRPGDRFQSPQDLLDNIKLLKKHAETFSTAFEKHTKSVPSSIPCKRSRKIGSLYLSAGLIVVFIVLGISFFVLKGAKSYQKQVSQKPANGDKIVLRWDPDGNITFMNNYGKELFGYDADEILRQNLVGTIVPKTESSGRDLERMIEDIEKNPERYRDNFNQNIRSNGELIWIQWTNKPIFDEEGNMSEILSTGKQINDPNIILSKVFSRRRDHLVLK